MPYQRIATFLILVQGLLFSFQGQAFAQPVVPQAYSFSEDELFSGLTNDLLTLIIYDKIPKKIQKRAALNLYDLLFQLWLVKGKHGDNFLDKSYVHLIMRYVGPYVNLDDPMDLLRFYDGNTLNNLGLTKTGLEPLRNADQIFQNKADYLRLVAEFSSWRNGLTRCWHFRI
jgi:hypothetical protein